MINNEIALTNLIDICEILKKCGVKHWLQDGTLLGLYRDNGFISHDTDTDIGALFETFNPACLKELINHGFILHRVFGYVEDSLEIALMRGNVKTDIFFHYRDDTTQYHCAFTGAEYTRRVDYVYKIFDTKEVAFQGANFQVPEDILYFIITKYGEKWNVPDKQWDYATSPKNHKLTDIYFDRNVSRDKFISWLQGSQK